MPCTPMVIAGEVSCYLDYSSTVNVDHAYYLYRLLDPGNKSSFSVLRVSLQNYNSLIHHSSSYFHLSSRTPSKSFLYRSLLLEFNPDSSFMFHQQNWKNLSLSFHDWQTILYQKLMFFVYSFLLVFNVKISLLHLQVNSLVQSLLSNYDALLDQSFVYQFQLVNHP